MDKFLDTYNVPSEIKMIKRSETFIKIYKTEPVLKYFPGKGPEIVKTKFSQIFKTNYVNASPTVPWYSKGSNIIYEVVS